MTFFARVRVDSTGSYEPAPTGLKGPILIIQYSMCLACIKILTCFIHVFLLYSTTTTLALYLHDHKTLQYCKRIRKYNSVYNNNNYNKKSLNKTNQIISDQEFDNNFSVSFQSGLPLVQPCTSSHPQGPIPFRFIYHFERKGAPFVSVLLKKGTPFIYLL